MEFCWLSPDLLRDRLKLLSRLFNPPDPRRARNSLGLLTGLLEFSSSATSGSGKTVRSYKYNLHTCEQLNLHFQSRL